MEILLRNSHKWQVFSQIGYLLTCLEIKLTQTKIQNISAAKIAVTNHQDNMSDFENKSDAGEPNILTSQSITGF